MSWPGGATPGLLLVPAGSALWGCLLLSQMEERHCCPGRVRFPCTHRRGRARAVWPGADRSLITAVPGVRGHAKGRWRGGCWLCHLLTGADAGPRDEQGAGPEPPGVPTASQSGLAFPVVGQPFWAHQTLQGLSWCGLHVPRGALILAFLVSLTNLAQEARCPFLMAAQPACPQVTRALLGVNPTSGFPSATRPESRPGSTPVTLQLHTQAALPVHGPMSRKVLVRLRGYQELSLTLGKPGAEGQPLRPPPHLSR